MHNIMVMSRLLKEIHSRRELLALLVARNLKIRYKNTALGFLWSLLGPLCLIAIYSVFAGIMRWHESHPMYFQFLVIGIVVWHFLATCLNDSLHIIVGNPSLVKKTAFPRVILPLAMTAANLVNFLLTCVVLVVYLAVLRVPFGNVVLLPLVIATQCALCLGMALLISAANVFFRDTEHILNIGTLAWFFLSPVFYSADLQTSRLPDGLGWLVFLNPMTGLLSAYRSALMSAPSPDGWHPAISFAVSWAALAVGLAVFQGMQPRFADEL